MTVTQGEQLAFFNEEGHHDAALPQTSSPDYSSAASSSPLDLREALFDKMLQVTQRFQDDLEERAVNEPHEAGRENRVTLEEVDPAEILPDSDYRPRRAFIYSSRDPWRESNRALVAAARRLTDGTIKAIDMAETLMQQHGSTLSARDRAQLTYRDARRADKGKRPTIITNALRKMDPVMGHWIDGLPAPEGLYPIAHPECGTRYYDVTHSKVMTRFTSLMLKAIVIGTDNGWAVREREALMEHIARDDLETRGFDNDELRLFDIGTGTGDPISRSAGSLLASMSPDKRATIVGADLFANQLAVAKYNTEQIAEKYGLGERLQFVPRVGNVLLPGVVRGIMEEFKPDISQGAGLIEYTASNKPANAEEAAQRKIMQAMGAMSTEQFYAEVYAGMPVGSCFIGGQMQPNRESRFVTSGLGWGTIIQAPLPEYNRRLQDSGIPSEALTLYVPNKDPHKSAGVNNMIKINKLA